VTSQAIKVTDAQNTLGASPGASCVLVLPLQHKSVVILFSGDTDNTICLNPSESNTLENNFFLNIGCFPSLQQLEKSNSNQISIQ
jgi:hypothetical protein